MKSIELTVLWVALILTGIPGCDNNGAQKRTAQEQKTTQDQHAQDKVKRDRIIDELKKAQNADDTWSQRIDSTTWTIDLQDRMIDKRIVSFGMLVDVARGQDNKLYLHFIQESISGPRYDFFLTCAKPEKLPENVRTPPEYFFVAKVQSLRKETQYPSNQRMTGYTTEKPRFTIRGDCVELRLNEERIRREQEDFQKFQEARKNFRSLMKE